MSEQTPQFTPEEAALALSRSWDVHRQAFGPILEPAFVDNVPVRIHLVAALNLISRREVKPGLQKLQEIKEYCQTPEDWAAWYFFVGLCFEMAGIREQMLTFYEKSGEYDHRFYLPYLKLAKTYHTDEDYEKAEKYYLKGIGCLDEKTETILAASAWANYASCLVSWGKLKEAEKALLRSKSILPEFQSRDAIESALLLEMRRAGLESTMMEPKMEEYRRLLVAAGFSEALKTKNHFWKQITELTAFIVNLNKVNDGINVIYGYASTAFTRMIGDENALIDWGVRDSEINIREMIVISDEIREASAVVQIRALYEKYLYTEKDKLLAQAKEKRKAFIKKIAVKLKPLGFKKKANTWRKELNSDYYLMFNAQKSSYADEYYFNVYIGKNGSNQYGNCFYTRVAPENASPLDWQLYGSDDFDVFLDHEVVPMMMRIVNTPLQELGKDRELWKQCYCQRNICEPCWMEKNVWEAKAVENENA